MDLPGTHALVTGASRGIGALIAQRAAQRGAVVTLVARSAEPLRAIAAAVGGHALPADLRLPAEREALVDRAEREASRPVEVLVNAAGVDAVGSLVDLDAQTLETVFQVNLVAAAELCRQAVPGMLARGRGQIVNVSSGFSSAVAPALTPYCASKAGLSHFTGGLRVELAGSGVGTTLVELGPVRTHMYEDIERHPLAGPALARFIRLRQVREVKAEDVAARVVRAVEQGRQRVVLPRRMATAVGLTWLPRRVSHMGLVGLPKR